MEDHNYCSSEYYEPLIGRNEESNTESSNNSDTDDECTTARETAAMQPATNIRELTYILKLSDDGIISIVNQAPEDAKDHTYFPVTLPVSKIKSLANPFAGAKKLHSKDLKPLLTRTDQASQLHNGENFNNPKKKLKTKTKHRAAYKNKIKTENPGEKPDEESSIEKIFAEKLIGQPSSQSNVDLTFVKEKYKDDEKQTKRNEITFASLEKSPINSNGGEENRSSRARTRRPPTWLADPNFVGTPYK